MALRSDGAWIIKAANRGANHGRILRFQPEELGATVRAEGSDAFVLQVLFGHASGNLKVVPFKAGPGDKGCTRGAPAILAMTVANTLGVKLTLKANGAAKAASLNGDATFNVHSGALQRCGHPGQQHGLRMPPRILSMPTSMRRFLVASCLAEVTQQIHSFRASGVISAHRLLAVALDSRAFRKSAGNLWTVPSASF